MGWMRLRVAVTTTRSGTSGVSGASGWASRRITARRGGRRCRRAGESRSCGSVSQLGRRATSSGGEQLAHRGGQLLGLALGGGDHEDRGTGPADLTALARRGRERRGEEGPQPRRALDGDVPSGGRDDVLQPGVGERRGQQGGEGRGGSRSGTLVGTRRGDGRQDGRRRGGRQASGTLRRTVGRERRSGRAGEDSRVRASPDGRAGWPVTDTACGGDGSPAGSGRSRRLPAADDSSTDPTSVRAPRIARAVRRRAKSTVRSVRLQQACPRSAGRRAAPPVRRPRAADRPRFTTDGLTRSGPHGNRTRHAASSCA